MRKTRGGREPESIGARAPLPGPLGRAIHSRSSRPVHRVIRSNPPPFERPSRAFAAICGKPTEGHPRSALRPRSQRIHWRTPRDLLDRRKGSPRSKLRRRRPSEDRPLPLPGEFQTSPHDVLEGIWDRLATELRREVTDFTFHLWLDPLEPVGHVGGTLFLRAPNHIRMRVEEEYLPVLRRAAARAEAAESIEIVDTRWKSPAAGTGSAAPAAGEALHPRHTL